MFADMATDLEAARLLIYRTAANAEGDQPSDLAISLAKVKPNYVGHEVIDGAIQIHGDIGYM